MRLLPTPQPLRPSNDDTMGRGMEMALTILVFVGLGFGLDVWLGTKPWCTIVLVVFAFVGQFVKMWFTYNHRMRQLEAERAELSRSSPRPDAPR